MCYTWNPSLLHTFHQHLHLRPLQDIIIMRLAQSVESSQFKAVVQQVKVDFSRQTHETNRCAVHLKKLNVNSTNFHLYLSTKKSTMTIKTQIIKSTLLYQSENWTLTSKDRQMLTTTEMMCLRKAAGKTRIDQIRSKEIRQ